MTPVHFDVGFFDSPIFLLWSAIPKKMKEFYSILVYLSLLILPNTRRTSGSNVEETSERYKIDGKITIQGFKSSGTSWTLLIWKYVKSASVSQNSWFFESHTLTLHLYFHWLGCMTQEFFLLISIRWSFRSFQSKDRANSMRMLPPSLQWIIFIYFQSTSLKSVVFGKFFFFKVLIVWRKTLQAFK